MANKLKENKIKLQWLIKANQQATILFPYKLGKEFQK